MRDNHDMMDLKMLYRMAIFTEVASLNSMSRAAEQLGISKSVVSRNIKWLEQDLNLSLLTRTRQNVTLTEAGRNYYQKCMPILINAHQLKEQVYTEKNDMQGEIILSYPFSLYQPIMPPLIDSFIKKYPLINFNLSYSDQMNDILSNKLDIYLHLGPLENSNLYAKKIIQFTYVCVASAEYLSGIDHPVATLEDVQRLNWIVHTKGGLTTDITTTSPDGTITTFTPQGNIKTNFRSDKLNFVSNNLGVSVLPLINIETQLNSGELVQLLPQYQWQRLDLYAIYGYRDIPLRVRKFIEHLSENVPKMIDNLALSPPRWLHKVC